MRVITFELIVPCRDDVPDHVVEWMKASLTRHAESEFGSDYDASFVRPAYEGPPCVDGVHGYVRRAGPC